MTCCTRVKDILDQVGRLLGDVDHRVWPPAQLVSFINEALAELMTYRPDAFSRTVTLTLGSGGKQVLPPEYHSIVDILQNLRDGKEGRPVQEVADVTFRRFAPLRTPIRVDEYEVWSWSRVKGDQRTFYVSPPVPEGRRVEVRAVVVVYPPRHVPEALERCLGVDRAYDAQVVDWVLARAYEQDIESVRNTEMAARHKQQFYAALGVEYRQESAFRSGQWLGRTDEGQPAGG